MSTVIELIEAGARALQQAGVAFGHGTTNAFDEAAWLTLWRLGLPLDDLDRVAQREVAAADAQAVQTLIAQRIATRRPAAYLTGEAWLQGVPFTIDERAIVPRSFIAELIANGVIDPWLGAHTRAVLDLCTGNASLAVLAALAWPEVHVDAADISPDALEVAALNVARHRLQARITLLQSDGLRQVHGRYDLILCNPPYVNTQSMAALPPEYRAEPALALAGGGDGMNFIRPLLAEAPAHLNPGGVLVLEIGHERAHFEAAFASVRSQALWLPTSAGEDQTLLLTREMLDRC
ncbi:MAG: 50S ribosomal protein L3 N(5)-glutamine methyltransferase [Burkholderiaceae bacterium]|jgi:ribosomal protein L3 glutamine methyltransferase|nr:50S ribosomal protein L3 N(5)-glutamine methyltransferase [Burkholderiaceae bacterium]